MAPDGQVSVFRDDSGRTNGNTFDAQGRLISCEGAEFGPGGRRRIVRTDLETGAGRSAHRPLRGQALQRAQRRRASIAAGASGSPIPTIGPTATAWRWTAEAVYLHRRQHGAPRALAARHRPAQRPGHHARRQDAVRHRQPYRWPAATARSGPSTSTTDGTLAKQRLVFDFGQGRGGDGMRLDRARQPVGRRRRAQAAPRARNGRRARPASTSSRRRESCWAGFRFPKTC